MDNIPPLQLNSSGTFCQRCSRAVMARHFVYQNVGRSAPRGAWTGALNRRTCLPSHRAFQMDLPGPLRSLVYTCVQVFIRYIRGPRRGARQRTCTLKLHFQTSLRGDSKSYVRKGLIGVALSNVFMMEVALSNGSNKSMHTEQEPLYQHYESGAF